MTSSRGRSVGGRTRSRIRSSISTRRPQQVLPPAGASLSETGQNSLTLFQVNSAPKGWMVMKRSRIF
jgi:hypothetical protein